MTGYINELCLLDLAGNALLSSRCAEYETHTTAIGLCTFLTSNLPLIPHLVQAPRSCIPVRWFGFDIRVTLAMLAMQAMTFNNKQPPHQQQPIPWHIWWHEHFTTTPWLDPFEMMLPSAVRSASGFKPADLAKQFNLQANAAHSPAHQQAEFARQLVLRSGALAGLNVQ